jgi:hypothetical protein
MFSSILGTVARWRKNPIIEAPKIERSKQGQEGTKQKN